MILRVAPYFNIGDKSGSHIGDLLAFAVYNNGPLQAGVLGSYSKFHIGPEAALGGPAAPTAQDSQYFHGTIFTKYKQREVLL